MILLRASARKLNDFSSSMTHNSHSPARDSDETWAQVGQPRLLIRQSNEKQEEEQEEVVLTSNKASMYCQGHRPPRHTGTYHMFAYARKKCMCYISTRDVLEDALLLLMLGFPSIVTGIVTPAISTRNVTYSSTNHATYRATHGSTDHSTAFSPSPTPHFFSHCSRGLRSNRTDGAC